MRTHPLIERRLETKSMSQHVRQQRHMQTSLQQAARMFNKILKLGRIRYLGRCGESAYRFRRRQRGNIGGEQQIARSTMVHHRLQHAVDLLAGVARRQHALGDGNWRTHLAEMIEVAVA